MLQTRLGPFFIGLIYNHVQCSLDTNWFHQEDDYSFNQFDSTFLYDLDNAQVPSPVLTSNSGLEVNARNLRCRYGK